MGPYESRIVNIPVEKCQNWCSVYQTQLQILLGPKEVMQNLKKNGFCLNVKSKNLQIKSINTYSYSSSKKIMLFLSLNVYAFLTLEKWNFDVRI